MEPWKAERGRDPGRIKRINALFGEYWLAHPGLRFGQVLFLLTGQTDPYYYEDDQLERKLEEALQARREEGGREVPLWEEVPVERRCSVTGCEGEARVAIIGEAGDVYLCQEHGATEVRRD